MADKSREKQLLKIGSFLAFCVLCIVVFSSLKMYLKSKSEYAQGTSFLAQNKIDFAIMAFENAAKAYLPGNPYNKKALYELKILARSARMRGEKQKAHHVWEVVRRSVLSTRHFYQPNNQVLLLAAGEIKKLLTDKDNNKIPPRISSEKGLSLSELAKCPEDPSPFISLILFAGMVIWTAGSCGLCFDRTTLSKVGIHKKRYLAFIAVLGLGIWTLAAWIV